MTAPILVARFADRTQTPMSCYCTPEKLDLRRGIALALTAYESRQKRAPPPITEARFESADGDVLKTHSADDIEQVRS